MASPKSLTKMVKSKGQPRDSGVSKRKLVQEAEEVYTLLLITRILVMVSYYDLIPFFLLLTSFPCYWTGSSVKEEQSF
jgi:hypothetical protein